MRRRQVPTKGGEVARTSMIDQQSSILQSVAKTLPVARTFTLHERTGGNSKKTHDK